MTTVRTPSREFREVLYEIKHSGELGRYLVAGQDIDATTLIICEKPLVSAPADDETSSGIGEIPMCLGCYKRMTTNPSYRCSKCAWPVCGLKCENAEHHAENECQVFVRNSVNYPCRHTWPIINKCILVLRTVLLKNKFPSLWHEVILKLEHHTHIRQTKLYCSNADGMIIDNLREFLDSCGQDFDEEITRISGVINVNAFSSTKSEYNGTSVRIFQCIYPQASLMAHSCIPNAAWTIDGFYPFRISIRATVKIRKGEIISIAYNIPEMAFGTLHRIIAIDDVAHFVCNCKRCSDPTEGGTFLSAIKCFECEQNYLLPKVPTDPDSIWSCNGCDSAQPVSKIVLFLNHIEESFDKIKKLTLPSSVETKKLNIFVRQHERLLHKNHYILQEIRMRVIKLQFDSLEALDETDLEHFIKHCKILLSIADKLMPGCSKARAVMQFFLSQGLLLRVAAVKTNYPDGEKQVVKNMYEDIHYLQTRSLLYFNSQHSINMGLTTEANQFVSRIQRQLKSVETFIEN